MKQLLFLPLLFAAMPQLFGQRLGVNKTNPEEALDVNGNIQLNGALKVNGVSGQAGQALFSTGTGLQWLDAAANGFRYFRNLIGPLSNFTWNVPAGVKEVIVEAWGGGGGGGGSDDGGGGYLMLRINTAAVSQFVITIGGGGTGTTSATALDGGNTLISWTDGGSARSVTVPGGYGANNTHPGRGGYLFNLGPAISSDYSISVLQMPGLPGKGPRQFYDERAAGDFIITTVGGQGGGTYKFPGNGGPGCNYSNTSSNTSWISNPGQDGSVPGGGGGSSYNLVNLGLSDGAPGMVIFRW